MSQNHISQQITVAEMSPHVNKISEWLIKWIEKSLKSGKIKPYDLLPAKGDLAFHTGVSKGTIQNVFRLVEDYGLLESKQKIGTYIVDRTKRCNAKLTSKRELTVEAIKKYIKDNDYKIGDCLISIRKLGQIIGNSTATIRIAIGTLISENILNKDNNDLQEIQAQTLVEKIADKIKAYIMQNFQSGEKLPANFELAEKFNVSIKTIHDSIKLLSKDGLLFTRRGQYGTVVVNSNNSNIPYHYERIETKIREYIRTNCEVGAKLPSILEFAKSYEVSAKTVKKALDNLADEGYVTFVRGRYGGTFVTDIPQGNDGYKWLAINPDFIPHTENRRILEN